MKTYEHLVTRIDSQELHSEQTALTNLGSDGWELVTILPRITQGMAVLHYYFRRERLSVPMTVTAAIKENKHARR